MANLFRESPWRNRASRDDVVDGISDPAGDRLRDEIARRVVIGTLVAFLLVEQIQSLLPFSFAFAAGAMLALIAVELLPKPYAGPARLGPSGGVMFGGAVMLGLSFALGV